MPLFEPEIVPIVGTIAGVSIWVVAILTKHQQKMAEIFRRPAQEDSSEVQLLAREMRELRSLVHQQALAIDGIGDSQRRLESRLTQSNQGLEERLNA